ncbi:N-acetyltransferase family protein [Plantactinospora sp. CA-290183]|uniref:GNAT family N-acetyltransferase n=1 Tax=Plantactinospora sp. CA-290183 TaxID=3240006 RepID=UPI003D9261DE
MNGASLFVVRQAAERDLDALTAFEITIAKISFGDGAITDPAVHRGKLEKALVREQENMFVAADAEDRAVGFLWLALNINFLTQDRYANLRSLAVDPAREDREQIGQALLDEGLAFARRAGVTTVTGKVHVDNYPMRMLYRRTGFLPTTLTMRARLDDGDGAPA